MLKIRGESRWRFEGSTGVSGGVDYVVGLGGAASQLTLKDQNGVKSEFYYGYGGIGAGFGTKFSFSYPVPDNLEAGRLYILDSFAGKELSGSDLVGCCIVGELSGGLGLHGAEGVAMVLGIPPPKLQQELATGLAQLAIGNTVGQGPADRVFDLMKKRGWFESHAKAVLINGGTTEGLNLGAGVLGALGYLWQGRVKPASMPIVEYTPREELSMKSSITARDTLAFIEIPGDILFEFNRFTIKASAAQELHRAGEKLRSHQGRRITINGYTDSIGSDRYNDRLSAQRASAVMQWLVSNRYVAPAKVSIQGHGERFPVAPNRTSAGRDNPGGRARNRRVEIVVSRS